MERWWKGGGKTAGTLAKKDGGKGVERRQKGGGKVVERRRKGGGKTTKNARPAHREERHSGKANPPPHHSRRPASVSARLEPRPGASNSVVKERVQRLAGCAGRPTGLPQ